MSHLSQPQNALFTCLACHVAFPTMDRQRDHYRTDWHKYNLKRKIAELAPVSAEQFAEKVLATQAKGLEEQERAGLVYECAVCRKSYSTENAFNNHIQSKRHKEMEAMEPVAKPAGNNNNNKGSSDRSRDPFFECLFCAHPSDTFDANMDHMKTEHAFFLPDVEYLVDAQGLVAYLSRKVHDCICVYCNGRGRRWKTVDAVRSHMIDTGHCKMAYDETEDPEELLKFYDFGLSNEDLAEPNAGNNTVAMDTDELVLQNGLRVGHRKFLKQYKQQHHPRKEQAREENQPSKAELEALRRRERRQRLAITDGRVKQQQLKTSEGIREMAIRQEFRQQVAVKHNLTNTLRSRDQVPK